MNIITMYFGPKLHHKGTKAEMETVAQWEVFIDTSGTLTLPFGYVTMQYYVTKPTKRQIRALKKKHRKDMQASIDLREWEESYEGIHCDIIGL